MNIIIGNSIALIAATLMVIANYVKEKKTIIKTQTLQITLFALSNLILGGFTGAIINATNVARNILCYKNKLTNTMIIILNIIVFVLSLIFNNLSIIGWLPVIVSIIYTTFMNTKNIIHLKLLIMLTTITWAIYDFVIKSYISVGFDIFGVIACIYSIFQIKTKKVAKEEN